MSKKKPIDINWTKVAELGMPVIGPFIQGALWYGFVNIDSRAQALGRLIAIAEIVPEGIYITGCMVRKGYTQKFVGELIKRFLD